MQKDEYWKQFVTTGKVFDYLSFKENEKERNKSQRGDVSYGTTYSCDRNGTISDSNRGL
ncbi:hypothetical protein [Anaerosacchariphilus polymeriproducens]|uniref:hypothetical protein n=1 Tax=Anaerosacchariphilus polymeriproducens TaxID=1812858 RepID=UPI0013906E96|nr:hypothetical protein [Anaerosacchariphilus polymeriproducens]